MRVQRDVSKLCFPEELVPCSAAKAVVENHGLILAHMLTDAGIGPGVEIPQERQRHITGAFGLLLVHGLAGGGRGHINDPADGLVEHFNAKESRALAVALRQPFQHGEGKLDLVRVLVPVADTGEAAVVIAVLAVGHCVQIQENLQAVFLRPVESLVDPFNTADKGRPVAEGEIRHRKADGVQPVFADKPEVLLSHIGVAVLFNKGGELICGQLAAQPGFILRMGAFKEIRLHPLFQDKPVSQIGSSNRFQTFVSFLRLRPKKRSVFLLF